MSASPRRRFPMIATGLLAAVLLAAAGAHAAPDATPIPCGPDAHTGRDMANLMLRWNLETTLDAYKQVGRRDPRWDAAALKFLEACVRGSAEVAPPQKIIQAGQPLLDAGCDDPAVLSCLVRALAKAGKADQALALSRRTVESLKTTPYPRCRAEHDATVYSYLLGAAVREAEAQEAARLAIQWMARGAAEPSVTGGAQRAYWAILSADLTSTFEGRGAEVVAAFKAEAAADPWIVAMVEGTVSKQAAWSARGEDVASGVTREGWKGFEAGMKQAATCFTAAWKAHPEYPEAATEMIGVAMTGQVKEEANPRPWFDRAVAAQMDYADAYSAYEWSLAPRWGGSLDALYQFGLECLNTKRFDTSVPEEFCHCIEGIVRDDPTGAVWSRPGAYDNLSRMFKGVLDASREPDQAATWKTRWATIAWLCGAYDEASRLLAELGDKVVPDEALHAFGNTPGQMTAQVAAATGPLKESVAAAEALYQAGKAAEALPKFLLLLAQCDDPDASLYLRDRVLTLRREAAFARGEWVDLTCPPDLAGWHAIWGVWHPGEDGDTISVDPGPGLLVCGMRLSGGYELRGRIQWPADAHATPGGIAVGLRPGRLRLWTMFVIYHPEGTAHLCHNFPDVEDFTVPLREPHDIVARVWDGQLTVYVDGKRIMQDRKLNTDVAVPPGPFLGFGGWASEQEAEAPVRYIGWQVHKLTAPPDNPESLPAATADKP